MLVGLLEIFLFIYLLVYRIRFILVSRIPIRFNETDPDPGSKKIRLNQGKFPQSQPKIRISYI